MGFLKPSEIKGTKEIQKEMVASIFCSEMNQYQRGPAEQHVTINIDLPGKSLPYLMELEEYVRDELRSAGWTPCQTARSNGLVVSDDGKQVARISVFLQIPAEQ